LIAEMPMVKDVEGGSSTFATPTIIHFGAMLLLFSSRQRPMASNRGCRNSLGCGRRCWTGVCGGRGATYASANRLLARIRRSAVSRSAAVRGICNAGCIGIRRSRQSSQFVVRGRGSGTRTPPCWHSQCVGRRHLPRRCG
jgi:hypothetical protein